MVPEGWKYAHASTVCTTISVGVVVKPSDYYTTADCGVRAFRSANVREGFINNSDWVYFSPEGHQTNKKSQLEEGDVLIVRSGYPGTACVVTKEFVGTNAIDVVIARPNTLKILPEYLCAFTNSSMGKNQVLNLQGGMAQKHLNVSSYQVLNIKLPPIFEQKKITKILSAWNQAITATERLISNSQRQKKALMASLLTGKKRLPTFDKQWIEFTFERIFKERSETGYLNLPLLSITAEGGVINRKDVGRKDTSNADKSKYLRICKGDIGYNTMRMWQGVAGLSDLEGIVSPAYTVLTPQPEVDPLYAAYLFKLPTLVHVFYRRSQGMVSDTWNLKYSNFSRICWSIPNIQEQKAITTVLSTADLEIENLQQKLACLKQEKNALMQQLLTGKRRVKVEAE